MDVRGDVRKTEVGEEEVNKRKQDGRGSPKREENNER